MRREKVGKKGLKAPITIVAIANVRNDGRLDKTDGVRKGKK